MRGEPCFICFDMPTPGRVLWVILRFLLVGGGLLAVGVAINMHQNDVAAHKVTAKAASPAAGPQIDHTILGDQSHEVRR
jgi:hypothetical protein